MDSNEGQTVHPNSLLYHPSCPGPVKAGAVVGTFTSPLTSIGTAPPLGIVAPSTLAPINAVYGPCDSCGQGYPCSPAGRTATDISKLSPFGREFNVSAPVAQPFAGQLGQIGRLWSTSTTFVIPQLAYKPPPPHSLQPSHIAMEGWWLRRLIW